MPSSGTILSSFPSRSAGRAARRAASFPSLALRDGAYVMGGPRSPSGAYLVHPTRFGVVKRDERNGSFVFVRTKDLEGLYGTLRECAVEDSGQRIACARKATSSSSRRFPRRCSLPPPAPPPPPARRTRNRVSDCSRSLRVFLFSLDL